MARPLWLGRLSVRVVLVSTVLATALLVAVAVIIADLYRGAIERRFDALLSAHLFSLVAATDLTSDSRLVGRPQIGDPRYSQPDSGWAWDVVPASASVQGRLASPFLDTDVVSPPLAQVPFDAQFERRYSVADANGGTLRVVETEAVLGDENEIARFRVMGDLDEVDAEAAAFLRQIGLYLAAVGLVMIAVNAVAIVRALMPLNHAASALGAVRAGEAERLEGRFPAEIEPLADEINALIENNRRIVDRARVQVGDLAHALKTPLAVITNEAGTSGVIPEQAAIMRRQIDHYLQRARFAAQAGTVAYRTDAGPVLDKLVRVFRKLSPHLDILWTPPQARILFAGEAQDLEEIAGNLMENAGKWARGRMDIQLTSQNGQMVLTITDDGPGIAPDKREEALKRGRRLDETKPGTGLGLAIVHEIVREYRGTLALDNAEGGGLRVTVALPLAAQ